MAFELEAAGPHRQTVVEIRIGIDVLGGPVGGRAELPRVHHVIVACRALVTVEARGGRPMADDAGSDARTRDVTLLSLLDEGRCPARMVDVAVRINCGIDAVGCELTHEFDRLRL